MSKNTKRLKENLLFITILSVILLVIEIIMGDVDLISSIINVSLPFAAFIFVAMNKPYAWIVSMGYAIYEFITDGLSLLGGFSAMSLIPVAFMIIAGIIIYESYIYFKENN